VIYAIAILVSYLIGSIPFGVFAGRLAGIDIREHGSKNIGATNVLRTLGKKYGIAVFLADALKGLVAVRLAVWFAGADPFARNWLGIVAAVFVVIGHSFPVWLRFRGGKGVATSGGACLGLLPVPTSIGGLVWIVVFLAFRYVSLASIAAIASLPLIVWLLSDRGNSPNYLMFGFSLFIALLVTWRHRENIVRLTRGTEPRFDRK
jgi:acyl phosphate:glycerol-3-phosphate acyltransferase